MRSRNVLVLVAVLATPTLAAAEDQKTSASCRELVASGDLESALTPCRDEHAAEPTSAELTRMLARVEFAEGDSRRAAQLWETLLEREGWSYEAARGRAMALWRAGETESAEQVLRDSLERSPRVASYTDLFDFLLGFGRAEEAVAVAAQASHAYPDNCDLLEAWGVAEASLGRDERAAEHIALALDKGCPRFRWTTSGAIPERIDNPAYTGLIREKEVIADLDALDDQECLRRLQLLRLVLTVDAAPAVTRQVLDRTTAQVRLVGLGLLADLGPAAIDSWRQVLLSDDFVLRKHALRRIREIGDPAFAPILEEHLDRETLPGNRSLTTLALGELLLQGEQVSRGEELVLAIPETDSLYAAARMLLADRAEAEGDVAAALGYIDQARAANPEVFVDAGRLDKLRRAVEEQAGRVER